MAKNSLVPGQSRVGYAWDSDITEPYTAMLEDRDGQITLVVPYEERHDPHMRRYVGASVNWGDDPDMTRFNYTVPSTFWFYDAHGFVYLGDVKVVGISSLVGSNTGLSECRLRVSHAVFSGEPGVDYSKINGLTTRVAGLGRWYGRRSVSHNLFNQERGDTIVDLSIHDTTTERVDRGLNLSIVAGVDWQLPGEPGLAHLEEIGAISTRVDRARNWDDHLAKHRALHRLLEVSAWQRLGFQRVEAMHQRDPQRVLSGDVVGERWATVHSYTLPPDGAAKSPEFMFVFDDIGPAGVRRWLRLLDAYGRGIHAMTFAIRNGGTSLDGLISDQGIGLEAIGFTIDVERGAGGRRSHHKHLLDVAVEVKDLLPFDAAVWATDSTTVYNDVKHADRPDPDASDMYRLSVMNRLVFRLWVARRLGIPDKVIERQMWLLTRNLPD